MLRITTTPPEGKKFSSASETDLPETTHAPAPAVNEPAVPPPAVVADSNNSTWKPNFLSNLVSRTSAEGNKQTTTETVAAEATPSSVPTSASAPPPVRTSADHFSVNEEGQRQ